MRVLQELRLTDKISQIAHYTNVHQTHLAETSETKSFNTVSEIFLFCSVHETGASPIATVLRGLNDCCTLYLAIAQ